MQQKEDAPFWAPWASRLHHACQALGLPAFARVEPMRGADGAFLPGLGNFCIRPPQACLCANDGPISGMLEMRGRIGLRAQASEVGCRPSEYLVDIAEVRHE